MRKTMLIIALGMAASFTACGDNEEGAEVAVTPETSEKVKAAQNVNTELEEIDGELDSLLNLLN